MDMKQKITKILEKASSTTHEAEAEALLLKAKRMMEEHQISAFEIGSDPFTRVQSAPFQKGTQAQLRYDLQAALADYLGLRVVISTKRRRSGERIPYAYWQFIGPESGLATLEVMFPFVWKQVLELVRRSVESRGNFYEMVGTLRRKDPEALRKSDHRKLTKDTVHALTLRLAYLRTRDEETTPSNTKNALVLIGGELDAYVANLFPDLKEAKGVTLNPSDEALRLAQAVRLELQVDAEGDPTRLLK